MKIVFMGTPDFAVESLISLFKAGHEIIGVVTQPDRPKGRGKKLTPPPVKEKALELGLSVYQPEKINDPKFVEFLKVLKPEAIIVVAYGQILSGEILALPQYGCINVHASLLPKYRGAAPIHWAIINGEKETGITTMLMDRGLDTGDMLLKASIPIGANTTTGQLHDQLAVLGGQVIVKTLDLLVKGEIVPEPQNSLGASYAPLLKKEHEEIIWNNFAEVIHNQIRGMNPWPGAYTFLGDNRIKIRETSIPENTEYNREDIPGKILAISDSGILVQTGSQPILINRLQPAGKSVMTVKDFINGNNILTGQILGGRDD